MNLSELLAYLNQIAPEDSAYEDDPVGLHIEPASDCIERVAVCLDATLDIARQAAELGVGLIISHHPLIYHPLPRLKSDLPSAAVALALARAGIGLYAMHTNWDAAEGGINDTLAEALGLERVCCLGTQAPGSIARIGELPQPMRLRDFAAHVQERLDCQGTSVLRRLVGQPAEESPVRRIAVCGGAGAFLLKEALGEKADAFVTSDIRHHEFLEAAYAGLALLDAGHAATETPGMRRLATRLAEQIDPLSVLFLPDGP